MPEPSGAAASTLSEINNLADPAGLSDLLKLFQIDSALPQTEKITLCSHQKIWLLAIRQIAVAMEAAGEKPGPILPMLVLLPTHASHTLLEKDLYQNAPHLAQDLVHGRNTNASLGQLLLPNQSQPFSPRLRHMDLWRPDSLYTVTSITTRAVFINTYQDLKKVAMPLKFLVGVSLTDSITGCAQTHGALHGEKVVTSELPSDNAELMTPFMDAHHQSQAQNSLNES